MIFHTVHSPQVNAPGSRKVSKNQICGDDPAKDKLSVDIEGQKRDISREFSGASLLDKYELTSLVAPANPERGGISVNQPVEPGAELSWTVHPLRDNWRRSLALLGILGVVLGCVWWNYREPLWLVFAGLVLIGSLLKYFFPTHYRLTDRNVEAVFLGTYRAWPWDRFRSYHVSRTGFLLSPYPKPHRMENFRGHYLLFGPRREEVIEFVRSRIAAAAADVGQD